MSLAQQQPVVPPVPTDGTLQNFSSIVQKNLSALFQAVNTFKIVTSPPSANDGSIGDIYIVSNAQGTYLTVKVATGWVPQSSTSTTIISATDFNIKGDGATDDTAGLQAWLLASQNNIGFLPPGTYLSGPLIIYGNTYIFGAGGNTSVIKAISSLPGTAPLLINKNWNIGGINAYTDTDITIRDIGFDGANLPRNFVELISLDKIDRVNIEDCRIGNTQYIGLAFAGSKTIRVLNTEFYSTGNPAVTPNGGAALWFGNAGDGSVDEDVAVEVCEFRNLNWHAIQCTGTDVRLIANNIDTVKEAGIFGTATRVDIIGNTVKGVTKQDISASGIDFGGSYLRISDNIVSNVDNTCIVLTDAQVAIVADNILSEARQNAVAFPQGSGIAVLSQSASPNQPMWLTIEGNKYIGIAYTAYTGIYVGGSGGALIKYSTVMDNNLAGGTYSLGASAFFDTNYWDTTTCINRMNYPFSDVIPIIGFASAIPVSGTFNLGDTLWNSTPTSGGFIGWVCIVAGTPGTWKTFGLIS